ncbi:cytochrome P460 family protein [Pelagibius sp.]|uniref:cytochrome P460 family protein n=1 Tax=Pelagibius sp. TaxID=1931238 RepID=UPI0026127F18|nr:cytochrome P460 family protein [Pelagibius sp.]
MPIRPAVMAAVIAGALAQSATAGEPESASSAGSVSEPLQTAQGLGGSTEQPRRHFRVPNPAVLSEREAVEIYLGLADELAAVYARSGSSIVGEYQSWQRYSSAPYKSMTHGRRYVSNYANAQARDYGRYEQAGQLPVGSVVVKDSFVVTDAGEITLGPLFVMEKMAPGFNYVTGDWRYSMISETGEFLGETGGEGAQRVEFCIACHLAQEDQDHLFFVPAERRVTAD